jgi:putative ABC transport system permease protein
MWGNYALSLYRTLSRHRLYAALNTLGLALGIAVCTILLLVVRFETSFDKAIRGADQVYRVNEIVTFPGRPMQEAPSTPGVLLPALMTDFPQIRSGARLMDQRLIVRSGPQQAYERVVLADPTIFDIVPLPFVAGSPAHALDDTTSLVVSQSMARKYFGTEHAVGRRLTFVIDGAARDYRVTGVMQDVPANSHLVLDFVVRYSVDLLPAQAPLLQRWGSSMMYTYIRAKPADAQAIQAGFPAFVDRHAGEDMPFLAGKASDAMQFRLLPLTSLHFADAKTQGAFKPGADPLFVGALGIMGVVTLLIALVNYVSLATARSGLRAREVAVRKVMGATRQALILQFVGESVVLALLAGLIAAALAEASLPAVSAMLGEPITLHYFGPDGVALPMAGLCVVVGLLAGVYPAIVLSGFRPASVLASARTPGGGRAGARVRQVMAVGQFAIAICLMICTSVIFAQTEFVRNADLGFRRDGLIIVQGLGEQQVRPDRRNLLEAFRNVPGVVAATVSDRRPATDEENNTGVSLVSNPSVKPTLTMERMSSDYMRTYGLKMVAGRPLGLAQRLDDKAGIDAEIIADRGLNIMVNESAAHALGFSNPAGVVGQRMRLGKTSSGRDFVVTIVGVTQDVRFLSPRSPPRPQVYLQDTGLGARDNAAGWTAAVRVPEAEIPAVRRRLETLWRSMEPGTPFQAETVQAALKPYYDPDARRAQLFAVGAVLSAMIACLGLYGLAAFNTSRRFKEIGIRKTLGASTADVMRLLIGEFLKPVLWANLIAWPLGFFAMRAWLAGFDQRISLNPAYFLLPTAAALLVAVLTVADQAFRVARAEPAKALRYE